MAYCNFATFAAAAAEPTLPSHLPSLADSEHGRSIVTLLGILKEMRKTLDGVVKLTPDQALQDDTNTHPDLIRIVAHEME